MAKDFAKTSKKRNRSSRFDDQSKRKTIPGWTWLIAGLLIGILTSLITYIKFSSTDIAPVKTEVKVHSAKSRYQAVPAEEAKTSDFSFHNILKNKVVEIPEESSAKTNSSRPVRHYIMQCGSFTKKTLAEALKANIAMNGFTANINATKEKGDILWYRVTLGPYTNKRIAEKERHQLQRNNINQCQIW